MKFFYYDLIFLIAFSLFVGLFLYKNKKKLQIESKIMILYRTKFGLDSIEKASNKFPWLLKFLANTSITCGYFLMISGVWLLVQTVFILWNAVNIPKIPPLMPLIPYLPSIFKIEFLPPFYFIYWILAIAIIAISHEFMHGVFARFYKIKLKSTGFGFLGPFLAAFVEIDEKDMAKKPIKSQLAILSGGSFANLIMAVLFFIIMNCFFAAAFVQSGVIIPQFSSAGVIIPGYALAAINTSDLMYNGQPVNLTELSKINNTEFKLNTANESYYLTRELISITPKNPESLIAYYDSPAYNSKIKGAIIKMNNEIVRNASGYENMLAKLSPGQNISIETTDGNYSIILGKHPANSSRAFVGISTVKQEQKSFFINLIKKLMAKGNALTYYAPKSELSVFVYNLLLWIVLINVSVMIINMLPFAVFDGGRFFYLSILALTKSKKKAVKSFSIANQFILIILIAMMVIWLIKAF